MAPAYGESSTSNDSQIANVITVALYDRGNNSRGRMRQVYNYKAYHWGLVITPPMSRGDDCVVFHASDDVQMDMTTLRMANPSMEWRLRYGGHIDPNRSNKLLGRVVIGQLPDGETSLDRLHGFFDAIPLPKMHSEPQESCVTWVERAIVAMQQMGWVPLFEMAPFKDYMLAYADYQLGNPRRIQESIRVYDTQRVVASLS